MADRNIHDDNLTWTDSPSFHIFLLLACVWFSRNILVAQEMRYINAHVASSYVHKMFLYWLTVVNGYLSYLSTVVRETPLCYSGYSVQMCYHATYRTLNVSDLWLCDLMYIHIISYPVFCKACYEDLTTMTSSTMWLLFPLLLNPGKRPCQIISLCAQYLNDSNSSHVKMDIVKLSNILDEA